MNPPATSHFRDYQTFIIRLNVFKADWIHFCMALIKIKLYLNNFFAGNLDFLKKN